MLVDVCLLVSHKCSLSILSFSVSISIGILIYNILITFLNCLHFFIYDIKLWGVNLDPRLNLIYFWKRFSGLYIFVYKLYFTAAVVENVSSRKYKQSKVGFQQTGLRTGQGNHCVNSDWSEMKGVATLSV